MTKKAEKFVEEWVADNIHATGYEPEGDLRAAKVASSKMLAAADEAGIARRDIEAYTGKDITVFMADRIDSANDAEVDRLAAKDD